MMDTVSVNSNAMSNVSSANQKFVWNAILVGIYWMVNVGTNVVMEFIS